MSSVLSKRKPSYPGEAARKARRRRLKIERLKSVSYMNIPGSDATHSSSESSACGTELNIPARRRCEGGSSESNRGGFVCGHVSIMGRRRAMEDAVTVAPAGWLLGGEYAFFAVYDGHGGSKVAETCCEKLHKCLGEHIEKAKKVSEDNFNHDWEKMIRDCFSSIDDLLGEASEGEGKTSSEERMMGSTAVVVLLGKEEVVVANCGDSRAVICRGGAAVPLSADHKPDRPDERERIEAVGGRILNWNGWRVEGILATSRALGDHHLKPYVSSEPEVTVMKRTESDSFLIIASDGLWDVVSNELACEVVERCLSRTNSSERRLASDAAAKLAELAVAKGSRDNISVIVVQLI